MSRIWIPLVLLLATSCTPAPGETDEDQRVILITMDGLRRQELYTGADPYLLDSEKFTRDREALSTDFWADTPEDRRSMLMPFVWKVISRDGLLFGSLSRGDTMKVTNRRVFSYPGYNEILTGHADDAIDSNDKIPNRNVTVLEWVNRQKGFNGRVAAFGSWDVFPYIINEERSGVYVNAGFESVPDSIATSEEQILNMLQQEIPRRWGTVRFDAFTHNFAMEYLKKKRPRLLYIAYGETDDFAHDGEYDSYLRAANRTDAFIREIWNWVQNDPEYRDRTTLVITTDHGRGFEDKWIGHGIDWAGADAIWMAVIGPKTPPGGDQHAPGTHFQNQVAASVAGYLGLSFDSGVAESDTTRRPGPRVEQAFTHPN
jgi:Sulfatase